MSSYRPSRGYDDGYRDDWRQDDDRRYSKRGRYEDDRAPRRTDRYDEDRYGDRGPRRDHHHHDFQSSSHPRRHYDDYNDPERHHGHAPNPGRGYEREREQPTNPPSASVILLGLPPHVTDILLRNFLEDLGAAVELTNVIMDRATGTSRRFGFAKFISVEHARAFVEPNYPVVVWKERGGSAADGTRIKINYSASPGGWREDQGGSARRIEEGKRQFGDDQRDRLYMNDGTRDIGTSPGPTLLLRGLDTLHSEKHVYDAFCSLPAPLGDEFKTKPGLHVVMMAKDRASRSSLGFAFMQLADVELAKRVLALSFDAKAFPTGFRIRDSPVALSFCHDQSFVPVYARSHYSFVGHGGQLLVYWDDSAFVSQWVPENAKEAVKESQQPAKPAPSANDAEIDAFFSSLESEVPSLPKPPAPGQQVPSTLPARSGPISIATPASEEKTKLKTDASDKKKKEGDLIISRKVAPHIAKWNTKQQELRSGAPEPGPSTVNTSKKATPAKKAVAPKQQPAAKTSDEPSDEFEYGDATAMVCLLCQRQFKSVEELRRHNSLSNLHKTNLTDDSKVSEAKTRKAKAVEKQEAEAASKYQDRAALRREAFNQPDKPEREPVKRKKVEPTPAPAVQPANVGIDEANKGSKMLEKMGWSKGVGLGSTGSGIVDPVQAAQFQAGAGLGASKGIAVGTYDGSSQTYAQQIKDKARQRLADGK